MSTERIAEIYAQQLRVWENACEAARAAAAESRDMSADEERMFDSNSTLLDQLNGERRALHAGHDHPRKAETKKASHKTHADLLRRRRLELQKTRIAGHDADMRRRQLDEHLQRAEQQQRAVERATVLENQRRKGELMDSLARYHQDGA